MKTVLEKFIERDRLASYFEIQDRHIRNTRGNGVIVFEGMQNYNAESIKSLEGFDRAWFTEAQRMSQTSLDILRPTIRAPGSELWFDWNPNEPTDPVDAFFRGANPPRDAVVVETNWDQNPWFPDVLRAEMEYDRRTDPERYAHIWLGKYATNSDKRVFKNWRVEEFETPADASFWLGADWGFSQDPAVLLRCFVNEGARRIYADWEAYEVGCELMDLPALFMTVPEAERWPSAADPSRPETISHMRKHGFPKMMKAVTGKSSVEEGIEFLRSYEIVVHPRCVHLIDELTLYSYKVDQLTGKVLPVLEDKHNHCIDALRYALEAVRRAKAGKPVAVTPVPVASRWS